MATGMIFDIQRCCVNDGPGLRTVVFLKGCPLRCLWCHNPESQNRRAELLFQEEKCTGCGRCAELCSLHAIENRRHIFHREQCVACGRCAQACPTGALASKGRECTAEEIFEEVRKDQKFYEKSKGGVTVSGGEPLMQPEFLRELLAKCREGGIHTAVETSGYAAPALIQELLPLVDLFLWDYKVTQNARALIGVSQEKIRENLHMAAMAGACIRLRCPIIPGVGDNPAHLAAIAELSRAYDLDGEEKGVGVLLEVHGEFNTIETVGGVIEACKAFSSFGILWDIEHSDRAHGDGWRPFYRTIRPYIRHIHIKDHLRNPDGTQTLCLPGEGDIPIPEIVAALEQDGFKGYYSLEWEKKWHPELPDPEVALPVYCELMRKLAKGGASR